MALWLVRAGRHGEHEQRFLTEGRVYLTWDGLNRDLRKGRTKEELAGLLKEVYPNTAANRLRNHLGQIWAFSHRIQHGDWIVLPSKLKRAKIHIGECTGDYVFDANAESPYNHYRPVRWIAEDIPRSNFDQDILYSFGAFMTVCQVKRNNAEQRVRTMSKIGWKPVPPLQPPLVVNDEDSEEVLEATTDLEQVSRDQIAKLILAKFKGHGMARLVEAILDVQGYTTFRSPEGPDKGIDLLAAPGPMGFGQPRICVQVKSGDSPLDRPTLDQLIGTMQNVQAQHGLLVSWGGFKSTIDKEKATQFFRVRLWDQDDLIEQLLDHYEDLDDQLRAELPLKRIWTVAVSDDSEAP